MKSISFAVKAKQVKNKLNFSWASTTSEDDDGNEVTVLLWINGDIKVEYKDKEYVIPLSDTVNALINEINKEQ